MSMSSKKGSRPSSSDLNKPFSRASIIHMRRPSTSGERRSTKYFESLERRRRPASTSKAVSPSSSEVTDVSDRGTNSLFQSAQRYGIPSHKKTINSYILPPKPTVVGQEEQKDYISLMGNLAAELNKYKHIVEKKQQMMIELKDNNRENLTMLSGIPENIALNMRLHDKQENLEREVAELEEKSLEASTYMLTLKLLEERNVITLSDVKRRIKELEQHFHKYEGWLTLLNISRTTHDSLTVSYRVH